MKTSGAKSKCSGLTLIELLVIIAVIAILAAMLLPSLNGGGPGYRPRCMYNLKQLDLGFIMYASDYGQRFPMQVPVQDGGTMEFIYSGHAFPHFEKLKKYIPQEAQLLNLLVCPKDASRHSATNFEALNDLNLSYFLNVDASCTNRPAETVFAGERDLKVQNQQVRPGLLVVTTNTDINWTGEFHPHGGNLSFADGHVEWCKEGNLNSWIARQPAATNRLCIP